MATTTSTRCLVSCVNAVQGLRAKSRRATRFPIVTRAGKDPTRGSQPSDAHHRHNPEKKIIPPLRATAAFLSDPFCDVVTDLDNKLQYRCPPDIDEDSEVGYSYRQVEFDFSEEEEKMGKEPGECAIGEAEDGMPTVDCGE